jgi:hypothetical protein
MNRIAAILLGVSLALLPRTAAAQAPPPEGGRPTITAVRLDAGETIALDGRLDEPIWKRAIPTSDFVQQVPQTGTPAAERTEVRVVFNADALYLGVICYDDEPEKMIGNTMKRDENLRGDDRFQWILDTFGDSRSGYFFEMNPSGLMADSLMNTAGQTNREWDGIWNAKVRRSEIGWTIEIELPFRTFNFEPNGKPWGINFQRFVQHRNEQSLWTGWPLNQGLRIQYTGLLLGVDHVTQGHGLDIRPYGVTSALAEPGRGRPKTIGDANAGADVFYSVTPALRANLTINTDFAQTEVDQRQVNLTQYSLFFPEKRTFFLEGASYFDFASFSLSQNANNSNVNVVPFFTRRIGLDQNGDPQKIDYGAKVNGQLGAQDVAFLQIRTGREGIEPAEDFTAARVRRRLLRQSYVGAIYTRREAHQSDTRTLIPPLATFTPLSTLGADYRFGTTTFHRNQNLETSGYYISTTNPLNTGKNAAWGTSVNFPNDRWVGLMSYTEVQENYAPAVGYTLRNGYRRYTPQFRFQPRPRRVAGRSRWGVQQFQFGINGDEQLTTADNDWLLRKWDVTVLQASLQSQDQFQFHVIPSYERLDRNFAIARGIILPRGTDYDYSRYRFVAGTAQRRKFAATTTYETGTFYSGDRDQLILDTALRPRTGVVLYMYGEWNRISLPQGRFSTRLYRTVLDTQFNPWIQLSNNIQYDSVSALMGWQSRFRWILKPGNDLYVVYTHNWLNDPILDRFVTQDRKAASKILYTYRF